MCIPKTINNFDSSYLKNFVFKASNNLTWTKILSTPILLSPDSKSALFVRVCNVLGAKEGPVA